MKSELDIDVDSEYNSESEIDEEDEIMIECNATAERLVAGLLEDGMQQNAKKEIILSTSIIICNQYTPNNLKQELCIKLTIYKLLELLNAQ